MEHVPFSRRVVFARLSLALVLFGFTAAPALSALTWIVPGVANTLGANGAHFLSDVAIANGGAEDRAVMLSLIPGAGAAPSPVQYTIGAGETLRVDNVLETAWHATGTGALRVAADGQVTIFARTYNVDSFITIPPVPVPWIGSALPVFEEQSLLAAGEEGYSGWVTHSADPVNGYRTNVALVFPDQTGGAATVTLTVEDGRVLRSVSHDYDSPQAAFLQTSLSAFTAVDVSAGRLTVRVTRGRAGAYTATADNGTGDLTIFPTERLPAVVAGLAFTAVSNGVAQTPGREGTFWQTEARLANFSGQRVAVTAYLLGGSLEAGVGFGPPALGHIRQRDLTVPFGATVVIPDLLTSLFNVPTSAVGAVLWRASGPLWIGTRTSSASVCLGEGTVGAASVAVPVDSFLTPADGPADLADLRGGNFARTNLLLAAGPAGAICTFEARRSDGRLLGSSRASLPPLGWGEFNPAALFPTESLPERPRVQVSIESGSADVQAAVVSSCTNDSVLYEALPRTTVPPPPAPPLPPGIWGAADGKDGLKVDMAKIVLDRFCRTGTFPQPARLDSRGGFSVIGNYFVNLGPAANFTAILSGVTDGQTVTITVTTLEGFLLDPPRTFILGMPYSVPPGPCPVEY